MPYEYKREPMTPTEQDRLVNAAKTFTEQLVIFTLLDSGLRESELVSLKRDNIQWQQATLVIWGKGKKRRVVPLSQRCRRLLEGGMCEIGARQIQRLVKAVAGRAGITKTITPHVLRHTFAMRTLESGVSIVALQKLLGHADIRTTMIYLNMSNEDALGEYKRKIG